MRFSLYIYIALSKATLSCQMALWKDFTKVQISLVMCHILPKDSKVYEE